MRADTTVSSCLRSAVAIQKAGNAALQEGRNQGAPATARTRAMTGSQASSASAAQQSGGARASSAYFQCTADTARKLCQLTFLALAGKATAWVPTARVS